MSDYSMKELKAWNDKIEKIVREYGLDCYEQEFEMVSYEDMLCYEAYAGMPSHYPHWSYGKAYERYKTLNKYNLTGLPYEMVINSNPCIAYLMKDNTLLLQILTMAHVYGHNDFFKNNRLFKYGTRAELTVEMFKNHADRIRSYIQDPSIGYYKVEKVLNAAHALCHQCSRVPGEIRETDEQITKDIMRKYNKPRSDHPLLEPKEENDEDKDIPELKKIPLKPEENILGFIAKYGNLNPWEKDILAIVIEETSYFIPQIETKIMNEGWASFWHYTILNNLGLDQSLHIEFLKRHNQVIRPFEGSINPYYIGFKIFENINKTYPDNPKKIFEVREVERDESFIRRYLTRELCDEMNLFKYEKKGSEYIVSEVPDDDGWKEVRDTLAKSVGMSGIPVIKVEEYVKSDNSLLLEHQYDGRELELTYAYETLKHTVDIWGGRVILSTQIEGAKKLIICDEQKKITMASI